MPVRHGAAYWPLSSERDLTGDRQQDLNADIEGASGESVIRLPRKSGGGQCALPAEWQVDTHGLSERGALRYVNDATEAWPRILDGARRIGHIKLTQERDGE